MGEADIIRIRRMRDAATEALQFAAGKTRPDLEHDRMLVLAILKDLEIIGEAASGVTHATKKSHPSLPWEEIIGMRNRLIHGHLDVNLDVVWGTIINDLPKLLKDIGDILPPAPAPAT